MVASVMPMTSGLKYRQLKLSSTIVQFLRSIDYIAFRVQYSNAKRTTLMDYCAVFLYKARVSMGHPEVVTIDTNKMSLGKLMLVALV